MRCVLVLALFCFVLLGLALRTADKLKAGYNTFCLDLSDGHCAGQKALCLCIQSTVPEAISCLSYQLLRQIVANL